MGDLAGGLVMVLIAVAGGGLIFGVVVLTTVYDAAKEAREYYRRENAGHRHDSDVGRSLHP